jgi:hypothetical protein
MCGGIAEKTRLRECPVSERRLGNTGCRSLLPISSPSVSRVCGPVVGVALVSAWALI